MANLKNVFAGMMKNQRQLKERRIKMCGDPTQPLLVVGIVFIILTVFYLIIDSEWWWFAIIGLPSLGLWGYFQLRFYFEFKSYTKEGDEN